MRYFENVSKNKTKIFKLNKSVKKYIFAEIRFQNNLVVYF